MLLPHKPAWFRTLRHSYSNCEVNREANKKLDEPELILSQRYCPCYRIGARSMTEVGCEIAAVYNALRLKGDNRSCSDIIYYFEKNGYLMSLLKAGDMGSDPYAIGEFIKNDTGDFFKKNSCSFKQFGSFEEMQKELSTGKVYIVSFWNGNSILKGLHTVTFYISKDDGRLRVFNLNPGDRTASIHEGLDSFADEKRFIVGYRL